MPISLAEFVQYSDPSPHNPTSAHTLKLAASQKIRPNMRPLTFYDGESVGAIYLGGSATCGPPS